jgi:RNA polymerase sigma-70 factor (ECF subfamily)
MTIMRAEGACHPPGDIPAFAQAIEPMLPGAFRLAAAMLGNGPDAAEATRDAVAAAWRELPSLGDPAEFEAWFDRILVNGCRMRARAGRTPGPAGAQDDAERARLEAARRSATLEREAVLDILDDQFERLDPDDRAMLALLYVEDRPVTDIAALLHLPVGTVKWRLHEARRALAAALESV